MVTYLATIEKTAQMMKKCVNMIVRALHHNQMFPHQRVDGAANHSVWLVVLALLAEWLVDGIFFFQQQQV